MKTVLLTIAFIIATTAIMATTYYVSPTGNDLANGKTTATAWKSITRVNSQIFVAGDNILFKRGGIYSGTITVGQSGNASNRITYSAYSTGANPKITGFTTVTGMTKRSNTNVYVKKVSTTVTPEILTVNGVQYAMGRTPNSNRYNLSASDYFHIDSYSGTTQITDTEIPVATANWTGAEAIVRSSRHMTFGRFPITNHTGNTITFTNANSYQLANGYGYFIQNDLRTLDQFGEWYFNPTTDTLYFYGNPAGKTIKISTTNTLITVGSKDYITIKNLRLEGANGNAIATTYGGTSNNLTVDNCYFDLNAYCIYGHSSPEMTITNNTFMRTSVMAVYNHWQSDGMYVANNVVDSTGLIISPGLSSAAGLTNYYHGQGMMLTYAKQVYSSRKAIVEYNTVLNSGYMGIGFSGDSMIVRNNFVNNFDIIQSDGGGIYHGNQDVLTNMTVNDNIVINGATQTSAHGYPTGVLGNNTHGIYLDYKSNGKVIVRNNTMANIALSGLYIHMSSNVTAKYNTIYNCLYGLKFQELEGYSMPLRNDIVQKNIVAQDTTNQYLVWARSLTNDFYNWGSIDSNYYSSDILKTQPFGTAVATWTFTYRTLANWRTYASQDANSTLLLNTGANTRFIYNATKKAKTFTLTGSYVTADGIVRSGSVILQPFTSMVLLKEYE